MQVVSNNKRAIPLKVLQPTNKAQYNTTFLGTRITYIFHRYNILEILRTPYHSVSHVKISGRTSKVSLLMMATFIQSQLFSKMAIAILFIYNLYIATVSSNPLPQFFFPKEVSFPDDETNDVRKCLNEDYSMPFFDFLTQQVMI